VIWPKNEPEDGAVDVMPATPLVAIELPDCGEIDDILLAGVGAGELA
jgi:hypothetical protein